MSYVATPVHLTAPAARKAAKQRSWKAILRRMLEVMGAPYAHGPYMQ
jgi:hypothetical protein